MRVEYLSHEQAAARFGITSRLVSQLICRIKKEPDYVNELRKQENHKECKLQLTVDTISEHEKKGIWTTAQVVEAVKRQYGFSISNAYAAKVLKEHFNMSYTMVSHQKPGVNAPRSLVVRSLYAKKMIQLLEQGYRVVNVD